MSMTSNVIFGVLAASVTFGAIQLASGRDLSTADRVDQSVGHGNVISGNVVNRAAKADRELGTRTGAKQDRTFSFRVDRLADTSVFVRLPNIISPSGLRSSDNQAKAEKALRRSTVACEPVVSVLTEIAKQLQPGRCVT